VTCKTITPIISTILLVLITIVASTTAYFWMMGIQEDVQQSTASNIDSSSTNDLSDFTLISVFCNATTDTINITLMNTGVGAITAGTSIMVLTDINGAELYTSINPGFSGLSEGAAATISYTSTYDLSPMTTYVSRLTLSNGKTRTRSCSAQ
jgi:flagellin-like protein